MTFGEWLRGTRARMGITQRELAAILHTTDQAISDWERGQRTPIEMTQRLVREKLGEE